MGGNSEMKTINGKSYRFLDMFFICLFLAIFIWTLIDYRMVTVYIRGIFTFLGFAFIYSKTLKDVSLIEKSLYWVSQNVTVPRTKYNHMFGGAFLLLIALLSFVSPTRLEKIEETHLMGRSLIRDPSFWMVIMIVLILNFGIGFYMSRKRPKGDN